VYILSAPPNPILDHRIGLGLVPDYAANWLPFTPPFTQANCFVAEYHYIEVLEAGHFLHREQSDQVNKILIDWLGSTAGSDQKKRNANATSHY
jgi:pimeloyl-ACP methyl ester carboxylesterase